MVTDALADILWTPSPDGDENLIREGVAAEKIQRVGNIMIDSLEMLRETIQNQAAYEEMGLKAGEYGLLTLHRPSNVDDPKILELLREMLSALQHETEVASSGFEAGAKVMKFKPCLVILDLIMPEINGFKVCRSIKENPDTSHIKVLAFTGYDTKENRDRIMKAGADDYLAKPVALETLLQHVENLLNNDTYFTMNKTG